MSLKKLLWSVIAGVSLLTVGCDDDNPPKDGETADELMIAYGPVEVTDQNLYDAAEIDDEPDGELPQTDYGPPTP